MDEEAPWRGTEEGMKALWHSPSRIPIPITSCPSAWAGSGVVEFVRVTSCGDAVYMASTLVRGDM